MRSSTSPTIRSRSWPAPFLDATSTAVGAETELIIDGVQRTIVVTGSVRAFPGTDPDEPAVLMDLATLTLLRFEGNDAVEPADEWWLNVDDPARESVMASLAQAPIGSRTVLSTVDRNRALATDPVALGIIGALGIGFVAAALFAVVGFMVSAAVAARERITEFALLRALGLSSGQLSVWLSLENAALAVVSLVAGSVLGLVIAWVVLPFITVTQGAARPFPPVEVDVPWATIAVLEVLGVAALALTVFALAWLLRRIGLASVLRMSED
jgi:ABC-type lipoprotein release transport system permease subunit